MSIIAIIQARMTSQRYPGKMLAPFLGKTVLDHIVDKINRTNIKPKIILATSNKSTDDPLAIYGSHLGLRVVRGHHDDVVGRFVIALKQYKCDAFFRVCGDSPLLLTSLFDRAALVYKNYKKELVTNVFPRTFPEGMSVELIDTKTFLNTEKNIVDVNDREHVTRYFYTHSNKFQIYNIESLTSKYQGLKLALDELEDLKKIEAWYLAKGQKYEDFFPILSSNKLEK